MERRFRAAFVAFLVAVLAPMSTHAMVRVVSLDYCADQYVLTMADKGQIAALSTASTAPHSLFRTQAKGYPQVPATAEALLAHRPTVALRTWGGDARLMALLERGGVAVTSVQDMADFPAIRRALTQVGTALQQPARAAALRHQMDQQLAALPHPETPVPVLYMTPGGVTAGRGTLIDALIRQAGARNIADTQTGWPVLGLETLVRQRPALFITGFFDAAAERTSAWSLSRHPVLRRTLEKTPTLTWDQAQLSCAGPWSIALATRLAQRLTTL